MDWQRNGWINALPTGAWHQPHIHERSSLSFIFYLESAAAQQRELLEQIGNGEVGGGILQFLDPRGAAPYMATEWIDNTFGAATRIIPEAGLLLLFPSFLQHFVAPTDVTRLSLAGNIFGLKVRSVTL